ncbi:MAG: aminoacyl-tRNA hydrolase [Bacilli bacterium]|nr:aminoacyl-tRNA hydrolase [Bacilli bacterium]
MKLIVGLGNPGKKYEHTRHNMGFDAVDLFADLAKIDVDKDIFKGLLGRGKVLEHDVMVLKPQTFMNLSGESVRAVMDYFKIDIDDIVVVFDDMALPVGKIRLRANGSSGGHKGMQNIIDHLGTDKIKRIKIGIGEPTFDAIDYVLGKPSKDDAPLIQEAIEKAVEALKEYLKRDFDVAMNKFN